MRRVESRLDGGVSHRREDVRAGGELIDAGRGSVDRREGALVVKQNVSIASTQKGFMAKAAKVMRKGQIGNIND